MSKHINMKNIITVITGLLFSIILVCLMTLVSSYTKAAPSTIQYNASAGVEYYVSGQYVEYDDVNKKYVVTKNSPVTIAVINNNMISQAENDVLLTVKGKNNTYNSKTQIITFNAVVDEEYSINVNTRAISKADHGRSLSDPYIIKSFNEFKVLYKVLAGLTLDSNESNIYSDTFDGASKTNLQVSYFKLFDNIIVDMDEYYGLKDFKGVFDFNGYNLTLNVTNRNYMMATHGDSDKKINVGLFSTLSDSTNAPCVIKNGKLRGSISMTPNIPDESGKIYIGGVAGKSSGAVVIDDIQSSISLSVDDNTSIYMGGFFGSVSSPIEKHNNIVFNGVHTVLSATTSGENAYAYVGGYAGTIDNTYVTGYTDESHHLTIIANSMNESAGGAVSGGFAGAIDHQVSSYEEISIDNILFKTKGVLSISSSVNNNSDNNANAVGYAVAGGVFGVSYGTKPIKHGLTKFIDGTTEGNKLLLDVFAQNQSEVSQGNTFAGGLYGHVSGRNEFKYIPSDTVTIFDCDVIIKSEQNGHDIAKAGGMFGHGAFTKATDEKLSINLTSEKGSIDILAEQTGISNYEDTKNPKEVSAGYFTASLPTNYSVNNIDFTINNGTLIAQRSIGSTIIGPVYAGGFAGSAISDTSGSSNNFTNININLNDSNVAAHGLSFESNLNAVYKGYYANVASAGFIGFVENYGNANIVINNNQVFSSSSQPGIDNVSVNINLTSSKDYVLRSVQNAVSANSDHCTEGYLGGIVGYSNNSFYRNIKVNGDESFETLFNLICTNSPNTAACGGLIGENTRENGFSIDGGEVSNIHIILDAYYKGSSNHENTYDSYCGGAVGVVATGNVTQSDRLLKNLKVTDCEISCIGENTMLTYAGGLFGGVWWQGTIKADNCQVINSTVYASSMGFKSFSGGICGMGQGDSVTFNSCYVIDTNIDVYSKSQDVGAAGICGTMKTAITLSNCYTNAALSAITTGSKSASPIIYSNNSSYSNNYFEPFNVQGVVENVAPSNIASFYDSANNKHLAIGASGGAAANGIQSSIYLANSNSVTIYPNAVGNPLLSVEYVGDTNLITKSTTNDYRITASASGAGTIYANLYLTIGGTKYLFTSHPIYVNSENIVSSNFSVIDVESNNIIDSKVGNDYYVLVQAGADEKQKIRINFTTANPIISLYNPNVSTSSSILDIISDLKAKSTSTVSVNTFNEKVDVEINDKYILLTVNPDILSRTVIGLKLNSSYIFVDYIPNYVDYIYIEPSSSTPSLGEDADGYHIFSPNDTIVMDSYEIFVSGDRELSNVVTYNEISGTGSYVTGYSNGRFDISSTVPNGYKFTITATYNGSLSDGSVDSATYNIVVYSQLNVTVDIVGASYTGQRKAVIDHGYTFSTIPNPGFGLSPNLVSIKIGDIEYVLEQDNDTGTDITYISNVFGMRPQISKLNQSITVLGKEFIVSYDHDTGGYEITIPGTAINDNIYIQFNYSLTADIIFDFGYAYSKKGNERYYIYTVKTGTPFNSELYESIKDHINVSLYGYQRQDYYLTDTATSIESFGSSLDEIIADGSKVINGPLYFYARWTNEAIIEYPDGISVESTLPIGLLEETVGGGIKLIPITSSTAFTFKIIPDVSFEGTPSFFVYIYNEYGEFVDITEHCTKNELGGYDIDPMVIDGIIYIKVFNQNLIFNDGESEVEESVDVEIYGDSIFTINYSINYAKEGVSKDNAVLGNNMSLQFNKSLPSGTSIRLYRSYNSSAKDVYVYKLNSESDIIDLSSFINMYDGKTLANSEIIGTSIFNETYYFVVTLPNNKQVTNFLSDNFVQFNVSYEDSGNINVIEYLSEGNKGNITVRPDYSKSGLGKVYFHVNQTIGVNVNESNNKLTVSYGDKAVIDGEVIEDLRHKDKYYVWEVYNPNGVNVTSSDAVFGKTNFVTNTLSASYYLANGTTADITSLPSGTIIRLLEVTNTLSPASGVVLYTKTI